MKPSIRTVGSALFTLLSVWGCGAEPPPGAGISILPTTDAGSTSDGGRRDAGNDDVGADEDANPRGDAASGPSSDGGAPPPGPKLRLLHAAPGLGSVRLCLWSASTKWGLLDQQLPLTESGSGFGAVSDFPVSPFVLAAMPDHELALYAVRASAHPKERKCSEIFTDGASPPAASAETWQLRANAASGLFPKATFVVGKRQLLTLLGCPAGRGASGKELCGEGYDDATGNLRAFVLALDGGSAPTSALGARFLQLSPRLQALSPLGTVASFVVPSPDAGLDQVLEIDRARFPSDDATAPTIGPSASVAIDGLMSDRGAPRFQLWVGYDAGERGDALLGSGWTLAQIELATTGSTAPFLADGKGFTFIAVGDPYVTASTTNEGLRILALEDAP